MNNQKGQVSVHYAVLVGSIIAIVALGANKIGNMNELAMKPAVALIDDVKMVRKVKKEAN